MGFCAWPGKVQERPAASDLLFLPFVREPHSCLSCMSVLVYVGLYVCTYVCAQLCLYVCSFSQLIHGPGAAVKVPSKHGSTFGVRKTGNRNSSWFPPMQDCSLSRRSRPHMETIQAHAPIVLRCDEMGVEFRAKGAGPRV